MRRLLLLLSIYGYATKPQKHTVGMSLLDVVASFVLDDHKVEALTDQTAVLAKGTPRPLIFFFVPAAVAYLYAVFLGPSDTHVALGALLVAVIGLAFLTMSTISEFYHKRFTIEQRQQDGQVICIIVSAHPLPERVQRKVRSARNYR